MNKQRILIPLDDSEFSRKIFTTVQNLLSPEQTEVILFKAIEPKSVPFLEGDLVTASEAIANYINVGGEGHARREAEEQERRYYREEFIRLQHVEALTESAKPLADAGFSVKAYAEIGDAVEHILAYVRNHNIDMIAMATHGRSGLNKLVMGSIAERVLHESTVPVLLIRPVGHTPLGSESAT